MNIAWNLRALWMILTNPLRRTYTANECGHKTKRRGFIRAEDVTSITMMGLADNGCPDYCFECINKMTIKCAWCGRPIMIGDPVTLYTPKETYKVPEYAVPYTEDGHDELVGCLGWDCADTGGDIRGFWVPPGQVHRVPSPIEIVLFGIGQGGPAHAVVVDDTHDPDSVSIH